MLSLSLSLSFRNYLSLSVQLHECEEELSSARLALGSSNGIRNRSTTASPAPLTSLSKQPFSATNATSDVAADIASSPYLESIPLSAVAASSASSSSSSSATAVAVAYPRSLPSSPHPHSSLSPPRASDAKSEALAAELSELTARHKYIYQPYNHTNTKFSLSSSSNPTF